MKLRGSHLRLKHRHQTRMVSTTMAVESCTGHSISSPYPSPLCLPLLTRTLIFLESYCLPALSTSQGFPFWFWLIFCDFLFWLLFSYHEQISFYYLLFFSPQHIKWRLENTASTLTITSLTVGDSFAYKTTPLEVGKQYRCSFSYNYRSPIDFKSSPTMSTTLFRMAGHLQHSTRLKHSGQHL